MTTRLAETVLHLFRVHRVALYQHDPGTDTIVCIAAATHGDPHEWVGQRLPINSGVAGTSYARGAALWIPDVLSEPSLSMPEWVRHRIESDGFRSVASVPVTVEGATIGALSVSDNLGRTFVDRDLEMLAAFAEQAATAIEKVRLFEESERRRRAADALARVSRLLLETLDPDAVAQSIADSVRGLLGASSSAVYRDDPLSGDLIAVAVSGELGPAFGLHTVFPRATGAAGLAVMRREPVATEDLLADPRITLRPDTREQIERAPYRAVLAAPLIVRGRVIGALGVGAGAGRRFDPEEIRLAEAFADEAALALENARLYEAARVRAQRLRTLARLNQIVSSSLDGAKVLREIARAAATLMSAPVAAFWLADERRRELDVQAWSAEAIGADFPTRTLGYDSSATGWVAANRRPLNLPDALADARSMGLSWRRRHGLTSFLGVPVVLGDTLVAVLALSGRAPFAFDGDEQDLLASFAAQAAVAIRNAQLYAASESRRRSLVTLAEVAQGVARGHDVPALLDTIAEAAGALFGGEAAFRLIEGEFLVRAGATPGAREAMPLERLRIGESLSGRVALTGEPASTDDILHDPRVVEEHRLAAHKEKLGGMLCVPLRSGGRILGTLNIYRERGHRFDEHAVTLATLLSNHAAVALENAELFHRELTARAQAEATAEALRTREEQYRALVDGSIQGMYIHQDGVIRFVNASLLRIFGYERPEELIGEDYCVFIAPAERNRMEAYRMARLGGAATPTRYETRGVRKNASEIWIEILISVVSWEGRPAILGTFLDITERRLAEEALRQNEEQLRQAQKMDAIGQLAGGIAHDFNNLLTVITGRSQLLLRRLGADERARRDAELIQTTAARAAALTRRLLAFSRKQTFNPRILDLGELVGQLAPMLQRLLPEDIEFVVGCDPRLGKVRADPTQLEQVLLNLVVNAGDAMPCGGRLTIETRNVGASGSTSASDQIGPATGRIRLTVTDTGTGMSEEVRAHLFEPFFTTKPRGKGTGLGLSTVYGIVQQHGGAISVASEPGQGTAFTIDLPVVDDRSEAGERRVPAEYPARGSESILLVEDEPEVRQLTREILEEHGYAVVEAGDPADALRFGEHTQAPIDLLLTDVVMPGMSGPELASRLAAAREDLPVLFMSAYAGDAIRQRGMPGDGVLVEKPFRPDALLQAVRRVLDGDSSGGGAGAARRRGARRRAPVPALPLAVAPSATRNGE